MPCSYYFTPLGLLVDLVAKAMAPVLPDRAAAARHHADLREGHLTTAGAHQAYGFAARRHR